MARIHNLIARHDAMQDRFSRQVLAVQPEGFDGKPQDVAFLEDVHGVVGRHLGDAGFDIQQMADALFLSRRTLERRTKTLTGLSPAAYLHRRRMERAHHLLENGIVR